MKQQVNIMFIPTSTLNAKYILNVLWILKKSTSTFNMPLIFK